MQLQDLRQHLDQEGFSKLPALVERAIKLVEDGSTHLTCMALAHSSDGEYNWNQFRPILKTYEAYAKEAHRGHLPRWWGSRNPHKHERLCMLSYFLGAVKVHVACQLARERAMRG